MSCVVLLVGLLVQGHLQGYLAHLSPNNSGHPQRDGSEAHLDLERSRGGDDYPRQTESLDLTFDDLRCGCVCQSGRPAVQMIERRRIPRLVPGCFTHPLRD